MGCSSSMEQLLALSAMPSSAMSDAARQLAAFSLFDWLVCARAGADQELSRIMRDFVREEGVSRSQRLSEKGTNIPLVRPPLPTARFRTHWTMMIRISPISGISPSESILPLWPSERKRTPQPLKHAMPFSRVPRPHVELAGIGPGPLSTWFPSDGNRGSYWGHRRRRAAVSLDHESDAQCLEPCRDPRFRPQVAIWDDGEAIQRRHRRRQRSGSGELCEARLRLLRGRHSRRPGLCCHALGWPGHRVRLGSSLPHNDGFLKTTSTSCTRAATALTP